MSHLRLFFCFNALKIKWTQKTWFSKEKIMLYYNALVLCLKSLAFGFSFILVLPPPVSMGVISWVFNSDCGSTSYRIRFILYRHIWVGLYFTRLFSCSSFYFVWSIFYDLLSRLFKRVLLTFCLVAK